MDSWCTSFSGDFVEVRIAGLFRLIGFIGLTTIFTLV